MSDTVVVTPGASQLVQTASGDIVRIVNRGSAPIELRGTVVKPKNGVGESVLRFGR